MDFVWLLVLCLVKWKLTHQAQSGICKSSDLCKEIENPCAVDNINSCFPSSGSVNSKHVTYDDEGNGEEVRTSCIDSRCTGPTPSNILLQNVTLNYVSINPRYFKLRVSWSLTEASGSRGGYELRLINRFGWTGLCYCIEDSNQTSITIHNIRYADLDSYKSVDILPYPYPQTNEDDIKVSQRLRQNIKGCADVEHNGTLCGIKLYPKPENLRVESSWCGNDTKILNITWDLPNVGSDVPLPEIYYVELYSEPFNYTYTQHYIVQNATQVVLVSMSAAQKYKVYVLSYRKCSGLGNVTGRLGCGVPAGQIEERIGNCDSSSPHQITTLYNKHTIQEQSNATRDKNLIPVLSSVMVTLNVVLVIAVSLVLVFLCAKLNKHLKGKNHSCNRPTMMVNYIYKVFVFYAPSLNQTHKVYIQKYVICNLLKYFKVITPDDINRGNISIWLEDAVNSADSVLLVGNEELCSEWEKVERSPILNSLELLISAAASQNTIAKFGFILMGERRTDVPIPENSYLKVLPVFFMGEKKCEMEKVYRFVTRSRGIELAQESNYDDKGDFS